MNPIYQSAQNRDVPVAAPGEFAPVVLQGRGATAPLRIWPPVVLAPMAGVTNIPFRALCRRFGAGLYVSEMITARGLIEGNAKTLHLAGFAPDEKPRSLQLYGVEPVSLGEAVAWLVGEGRVDHIDMNFGCPVRKVTRRGGGAALPWKRTLLRRLVSAAVRSAGPIPVTIKFRIGIDDGHETFLDAGRIAEDEGCAAVALHARSAAQLYDGSARWDAIARLKDAVRTIPVFGNGDIWEAHDALRMMRETGCDGVVVGRGCLGRPWLFRDLADVFDGREPADPPSLQQVFAIALEHAELLVTWFGEQRGVRMFRQHGGWYTKGFRGGTRLRPRIMAVTTLAALRAVLASAPHDDPFPPAAMRVPRGKSSGRQRVVLPEGWLDDRDDPTPPGAEAEDAASGG
ncbi:MAG: tRNA dihydrouridine synthase DusB [Deltaproteobacteria bacterium]|nr:tRNA dihydrouridine synthase DusB [Deltaproteobacteria bacterium]